MMWLEKQTQHTRCVLLGGSGHRQARKSTLTRRRELCRLVTGEPPVQFPTFLSPAAASSDHGHPRGQSSDAACRGQKHL